MTGPERSPSLWVLLVWDADYNLERVQAVRALEDMEARKAVGSSSSLSVTVELVHDTVTAPARTSS